jgi:hypothetical protein
VQEWKGNLVARHAELFLHLQRHLSVEKSWTSTYPGWSLTHPRLRSSGAAAPTDPAAARDFAALHPCYAD